MTRRASLALFVIFFSVLAFSPLKAWATADLVELNVVGRTPPTESEADDKQKAIADALRRAVCQVTLTMVDPATLRSRLRILEDEILAKANSFITTYSPQATSLSQDALLALVAVTVDKAALDRALAKAGMSLPAARLALTLVLVSEETAPGRPPVFWWSGYGGEPAPKPVADVLKSLGVKMIDPGVLSGKVPAEARQPILTEPQAMALAGQAGAGLILMGRVRTYPVLSPEGVTPPPLAQLELVNASDGKVLAMEEVEGPVYRETPGPQAALEVNRAVEGAVRRLLEKITGAAPEIETAESELLLTINGVRSLADLHHFEEVMEGLGSLVDRSMREAVGAGWAKLRLTLKAPASQLADQLLLQDFGGFLVNVVEVTPHEMKLVMIPR